MQDFLLRIPASMVVKVQVHVLHQLLGFNRVMAPLIQTHPSILEFMAERLDIVLAAPEEIILKEGDTLESKNSYN